MDSTDYIRKIKTSISKNVPYDEYKLIFFDYIDYLEEVLAKDPKSVKAVCQLAIAYLEVREPAEKSIELMEKALINYENIIDSSELTELLTNLAYFYENESCKEENAKPLLEKAVALKGNYPNPYNALGKL